MRKKAQLKKRKTMPKYPVTINLKRVDGNAFAVLGRVWQQGFKQGLTYKQWKKFLTEATASDYKNLLQAVYKYFIVIS